MQLRVSSKSGAAICYGLIQRLRGVEGLQFLGCYSQEGCNGVKMLVRILHLPVLSIGDPGLRIVLVEVLAWNERAIDWLAILLLDGLVEFRMAGRTTLMELLPFMSVW